MRKLLVVNFFTLFLLFGCGMSEKDKTEISKITCNVIEVTMNMEAAERIKEVNAAREQMGGERFLGKDEVIKESVQFGLCVNLVRNDEDYQSLLETKKEEKLAQEKLAAEKQRIADSKPTVKETFFPDGKLQTRTNYQSKTDGGEKDGLYEWYNDNGQLREKGNYKEGKLDGLWEFYENGQITKKVNLKDGKEDGLSEIYYDNGQLAGKVTYKDGKPDGLSELFHENGQLSEKHTYKDGKPDGLWESYYDNGQLQSKENYKDGKLDGLSELFRENGQLSEKHTYKDGKPDGLWQVYHDNGERESTSCYDNGREVVGMSPFGCIQIILQRFIEQ